MKRIYVILIVAALLLSVFAGCAKTDVGTTESGYAIDRITIGTTGVIESAVRNEYNYDMMASSTSELPLVYQDVNGDYHPLVAGFSTEDAVTWTYTVTDGMTWDDGEPVTAEDILFTLQYDELQGTANFEDKTDADGNVTKAKYTGYTLSEDKMSISLTLASPNVRELGNMTSFRVMPKHIYEGKTEVTDAEARIGCGPYKFESFNRESGTVSFVVNGFYPDKPNVSKIVFRIFGNDDTMYMALQNGDVDMVWNYSAGVSADYRDILGDGVVTESVPAVNAPAVLAFNNAGGLFSDERVRIAVSYAMDYGMFAEYFADGGEAVPNRGFVPATTLGYVETEKLARDTEKAEKLMSDAGYKTRNDSGFFVNGAGEEASFKLTFNASRDDHAGCAELVKTQLEAFGIRVELDGVDKDSYNAKTSNKFSNNNITMEAAICGYTSAGMGMGNGLGSIYVDGSHPVQGGCQVFDSGFTGILDEMANSKTLDEYCSGAAKLQQYYAAHMPLIALYLDDMTYAFSSALDNVTVDCVFGLNNVNNWFSVTSK